MFSDILVELKSENSAHMPPYPSTPLYRWPSYHRLVAPAAGIIGCPIILKGTVQAIKACSPVILPVFSGNDAAVMQDLVAGEPDLLVQNSRIAGARPLGNCISSLSLERCELLVHLGVPFIRTRITVSW